MNSDTLIVVILDTITGIFAGFAIFSIIGHFAYTRDTEVDKVAASGQFLQARGQDFSWGVPSIPFLSLTSPLFLSPFPSLPVPSPPLRSRTP